MSERVRDTEVTVDDIEMIRHAADLLVGKGVLGVKNLRDLADRLAAALATPPAAAQDTVTDALAGLTDLTLTQGHPEFGIECTVAIGEQYETVINQPDPITAIMNARAKLDAAHAAGGE